MIEGILKIQNLENIPARETVPRDHINKSRKIAEDTIKSEDTREVQNNKLQEAIERIVNAAKYFNRKIQLEVENDLGITVVKVIDKETGKVIRQIPPEDLVELSRRAKDLKGLLISKEG